MSAPASAEVVATRVLRAPPERLFQAFRDPAELAAWWGPAGFTNEFREFDPRPGGRWRFDMIGPDGRRYAQEKTFVAFAPDRIVLHHAQEGHDFRLTIALDEVPGGTRVTWTMRFAAPEQLDAVRDAVTAGNEQNLDRLAAHVGG